MSESLNSTIIDAKNGGSVKKVRSSNLELFRIITMIMIVAHHYVVNSGLTDAGGPIGAAPLAWRSLFLLILGAWGKIGINCFVLISGYFMCKSNITAKKFVKLLGEVMFYRIVIGCIFVISGYEPLTIEYAAKLLIPIRTIADGFTPAFLIFFLLIPFLNVAVNAMNEKQHIRLLLLLSFVYVFLGTVPLFSVTMNYVSWYTVLYFIASYVRIYPKKIFDSTKLWGIMSLICVFLSIASVVACAWLSAKLNKAFWYYFVTDSNTFLAVATGFSAFMFFKNVKIKHSKFINAVAASSFGVLLIHAHSDSMRRLLWRDVLGNVSMYNSQWLVIHAIVSVLAIWAVCTLIDHLRIRFIEVPLFKLWDKYWYKISNKYQKLESKLCKKLKIEETEK